MENKKQIRTRNIASFTDFIADTDKYRMEHNRDYSIQGLKSSSKLVHLIKEIARKKNLGR